MAAPTVCTDEDGTDGSEETPAGNAPAGRSQIGTRDRLTRTSSGALERRPEVPRKSPSLTSELYRAARTSNNARAALRGPVPYAKRVVRRKLYRSVNRQLGRSLRGFGL